MKILAATNSPQSLLAIRSKFENSGLNLITAQSSEEVNVQFDSNTPDLMILDKAMTKKSKSNILSLLRDKRKNAFPIIMISSSDIKPCIDEVFVLGVHDYIQRPQGHIAVQKARDFVNMDFFTITKSVNKNPD